MNNVIALGFGNLVRWAIFLALIGEISQCTMELKQKSGHSVQHGCSISVTLTGNYMGKKESRLQNHDEIHNC